MQRKRKGALKWFEETEGRFLVAFGGDGCPFGKNESACSFLISFLNVGKRVASSSDNILVFAGNVEETSLIVKKYINFVCKQIKDLKDVKRLKFSGMNLLYWLGYLSSIMNLVLTLLAKTITFLKGFLMTVTTATVEYIKLILLIRAAVYVVIISWH